MKKWLEAARLRTLPLALAAMGMGTFLAAARGNFRWDIFLLCALTTILLQVLSNLANDYGDAVNGADGADRVGPLRSVQSGAIAQKSMLAAVVLFSILSLLSGILLLYVAFGGFGEAFWYFIALGLLAILAAVFYTAGRNPYGYAGFGDLSVLLFFGFMAVMGSSYLFEKEWVAVQLLPALSVGLFSVGVLNVNNIRDIASDRKAGKMSIPVRIGREKAVRYHVFLIVLGLFSALVYALFTPQNFGHLIFLISLPLFLKNIKAVARFKDADQLDPYLKQLAISTLAFVVLFGLGGVIL